MSMHRIYVYGRFTKGPIGRCRLIYTIDKSQLASITYYSLFATRIICCLSCFCDINQVTQYSISIPGSVTAIFRQLQLRICYTDFDDAAASG